MVGSLVRWTSTSVVCLLIRRTWMSIVHAAVSTPKVSCAEALEELLIFLFRKDLFNHQIVPDREYFLLSSFGQ